MTIAMAPASPPPAPETSEFRRGGPTAEVEWRRNVAGLIGFDISLGGRACDPSCSDSLNGATNRIANEQFTLAA